MKKWVLFVKMTVSFVFTLLFGYAYYIRYLKWVRYFNELGRYYDPKDGG